MHTGAFHIFSISLNAWWWPFELSSAIKPMVQQSKIGGQNSPRLHLGIFPTFKKKEKQRRILQDGFKGEFH